MRQLVRFLLAALLLVLPSSPALAQPADMPTFQNYLDTAIAEIPAMAEFFGWEGNVATLDRGSLDANADRVSLNAQQIESLLSGVQLGGGGIGYDAVRMIVAHEVWHYVEFQRGVLGGPGGKADGEERRLGECRADVMAARYVASLAFEDLGAYEGRTSFDFNGTSTAGLASLLWRQRSADHPSPDHRRATAHFGALSFAIEHKDQHFYVNEESSEIEAVLGIGRGEDVGVWAGRVCKLILHTDEAAMGSVIIARPEMSVVNGTIRFSIRYANRSARRVELKTTIVAEDFYGNGDEGFERWIFPEQIQIEPGSTQTIVRDLPGLSMTGESLPLVSFNAQLQDGSWSNVPALVAARFVPGSQANVIWAISPDLNQADTELALAIKSVANSALSGFLDFRGTNVSQMGGNDSLEFSSLAELPDSNFNEIQVQRSGSARFVAFFGADDFTRETIFAGTVPAELLSEQNVNGQALFDWLTARLQRIWPNSPYWPLDSTTFRMRVSRYCDLQVSLLGSGDSQFVSMMLEPNVIGLNSWE